MVGFGGKLRWDAQVELEGIPGWVCSTFCVRRAGRRPKIITEDEIPLKTCSRT